MILVTTLYSGFEYFQKNWDVLMPGAKTAISKSAPNDGSLLATLGKPDGITLGELQRTAKNVLRMTLRTKFAGQYKD